MEEFKVSVIIPVFNAEKFVKFAVKSAESQKEVKEIILIEDGSYDNSLNVCKELQKSSPKVRLFQHHDQLNHGAGPSRNLGLENVSSNYIAFLDADDYFLKDRFKKTKEVFKKHKDAEGVYECLGIHYENHKVKELWKNTSEKEIFTFENQVKPDEVFPTLLKGFGSINLDTLTLNRNVLDRIGSFSDAEITQDTFFIYKVAASCTLYPGEIRDPVTVRRVHDNNRITKSKERKHYFQLKTYTAIKDWYIAKYPEKKSNTRLLHKKIFNLMVNISSYYNGSKKRAFNRSVAMYLSQNKFLIKERTFVKYLIMRLGLYVPFRKLRTNLKQ